MTIPRRQSGSALVLALGFMVVLLVVAAGVHGLVLGQLRGAGTLNRRLAAEYVGRGGIARAIAWFTAQSYQLPRAADLEATVPVTLKGSKQAVVLPGSHPDGYVDASGKTRSGMAKSFAALLSQQKTAAGTYSVEAALIALQPETWELVATAANGDVTRQVGALLVRASESLWGDGFFGRKSVELNGNAQTDSYDSSLGPYGGSNRFQSGDVRSDGDVSLNGNAVVNGDASPGPDGEVETKGNSKVTGLTDPAGNAKDVPAPTVPAGAIDLDKLKLQGNESKTLGPGTYVADSLSISSNGKLFLSGPVMLYVTGPVSVAGNALVNPGGLPGLLSIVQVGGRSVSVGGNTTINATIYAPDSNVEVNGNAQLFGAVIGNSLDLDGNAKVHFDEQLTTQSGGGGALRLVAQWTRP